MPVFRRISAPAALLLITICFYWKLTGTTQYSWLESPDLVNQVLPWWTEQARQWHAGSFPAWDPNLWGGQPLLGQAQPGVANPLNWLLFATRLKDGQLRPFYLNLYFVLEHFIAALNCYLLARHLKRSRLGSMFAGCLFSFGGFAGNTDWPQMVNGAIWAPLVFLFLLRANSGVQPILSAACSGCLLGLCWLSGHHQVPIFFTYGAGAVWLYFLFRDKRIDWQAARLALVFLIFFLASAGLQIFPALEYGRNAIRWVGSEQDPIDWATPVPYYVHGQYSFGAVSLLGVLIPGIHRHTSPLLGAAGLTAALLGLALLWKSDFRVRLFALLGLGGILVALGQNSVLHGVLYSWAPMMEKARSPNTAIVLFGFAFSILAAFGFDAISNEDGERHWERRAIYGNLVFGLILFTGFAGAILIRGMDAVPDERPLISAMVALLVAGALAGVRNGSIGRGAFGAGLLILSLTELGNEAAFGMPHLNEPKRQSLLAAATAHDDIAQFLRKQLQPIRITVDDQMIPYNFGDRHGINQMGGYLASISNNLSRLDLGSAHARQLFGVTHAVGKNPPDADWSQVFQGTSGVKVFRNPHPQPRTWIVHQIMPLEKPGDVKYVIDHPEMDISKLALVAGKPVAIPRGGTCGADAALLKNYEPSRVVVDAQVSCGGLLLLGDTYFPGWRAVVDGTSAEVIEADGAIRGVVLAGGKHTVEFVYGGGVVRLGMLSSALAWIGLIVLFIRQRFVSIRIP